MFTLEKFNLETTRPLPLPDGFLNTKEGFIVSWNGCQAELSPLTELSGEQLEDCKNELLEYESYFSKVEDCFDLERPFFGQDIPLPKYNTTLFCLESLLYQKFNTERTSEVSLNAMGSLKDQERLLKLIKSGQTTLKFKLGKENFTLEQEFLESLPSSVSLRLDANQKLNQPIPDFFDKLNLEYLEEPFQTIDEYKALQYPFALDENRKHWKEIENSNLKALIVKPSIELSISGTFKLAQETYANGIKVILSSAYETKHGLNVLFNVASKLDRMYEKQVHGLDGLDWFKSK